MLKQERVDYILKRLNELYPETPTPLGHNNIYELLIAVLLSAQCTDERVNKITPNFSDIVTGAGLIHGRNIIR